MCILVFVHHAMLVFKAYEKKRTDERPFSRTDVWGCTAVLYSAVQYCIHEVLYFTITYQYKYSVVRLGDSKCTKVVGRSEIEEITNFDSVWVFVCVFYIIMLTC